MCELLRYYMYGYAPGYAAKTVSQRTLTFSLHKHVNKSILILNCIYKTNILRPLPAKLEYFYLFDPCRAKNLTFDLTVCRM